MITYNSASHSLQLNGVQGNATFQSQVFNTEGQLLFEKKIIGAYLQNLPYLSKGIYFALYTGTDKEIFHSKFIVTE